MRVLAIETSCDETAAAVVERKDSTIQVLSNIVSSSSELHAQTGGIIPERAAREQIRAILPVITKALLDSEKKDYQIIRQQESRQARDILKQSIDSIAVTIGPGLIGSLLVGVETAKTLSFTTSKPLIGVNHLLAHLYANFIDHEDSITFPAVGLLVSGGHTDLLLFTSLIEYQWLGGTRDDAAGEAFDKIGRLINLSYPAGPEIEKRSKEVVSPSIVFQSPLLHSQDFDFSFSGLKTEVFRYVQKNPHMSESERNQVCYATQKAVIDVLVKKTIRAASLYDVCTILLGGGVSANQTLLESMRNEASKIGINKVFSPRLQYATDNAAMIGAHAVLIPNSTSPSETKALPELYFS